MVKPRFFLESLSGSDSRFEILKYNLATKIVTLRNVKHNAVEFQDVLDITDKKVLAKMRYKIVKEEA